MRLLLMQAVVIALSLGVVSLFRLDFISGDPLVYFARVDRMFSGGLPYLEVPYEHFPLMLLPMATAWALGGWISAQAFRVAWIVLTSMAVLLTTRTMIQIDQDVGVDLSRRWVVASAPLLPLIVFRTEPWVVLLVVWSVRSLIVSRPGSATFYGLLGVAAKGWPAILNIGVWTRGWRKLARGGIAGSALLLFLMALLPGFMTARSFEGLHSESTGGTLWMLLGSLFDWHVELASSAGAIYVNAPSYLLLPGIVGGSVIGLMALARLRRLRDDSGADLAVLGAFVAAFLLLSPLQSSQFTYWLIPFVVLGSRDNTTHVLAWSLGAAATLSTAGFGLLEDLSMWWIMLVAVRHGLIAVIGWRLTGSRFVLRRER